MSTTSVLGSRTSQAAEPRHGWWRVVVPLAIAAALALAPAPPGLSQHAWYYFALFSGVVAALVTEPIPNPAVGLTGLTLAAVLSRWVLFSPEELAKPGFDIVKQSVGWALSGFSSTTVWLVGGAFMFALGYEKTGLGGASRYCWCACWAGER
jgi:L-tartrate/succinate antiporter